MPGVLRIAVGAAAVAAAFGAAGAAASSRPTVAQIEATIPTQSDDFVIANAYAYDGQAPGHGWLDLKAGGGRWVSPNGKVIYLESVAPDPRDPSLVDVTDTTINRSSRTWYRTKRQEPRKLFPPTIIDPLTQKGVRFRFIGIERVDGRQTYHFRSTYFPYAGNETVRVDAWFATDRYYVIRFTRTTRAGAVVLRVDNRWLPRTQATVALLTAPIPSGFKEVQAPSA